MGRTSFIPAIVASWIKLLVPGKCFDEFFINFNLFNLSCYKLVLSKILGYTIVASSLFVKVPQIMKIWNAKSGEGISVSSLVMELAVLGSAVVYCARSGYPFSTYGELIFISLQSVVLTSLVLHFNNKTDKLIIIFTSIAIATSISMTPVVPMSVLTMVQAFNTLLGLTGKIMQVVANYKNGGTGLLSGVTVFMFLFNGISRIYTTSLEVGDVMIIFNYCMVTIVNFIIAGQMVYYRKINADNKGEDTKSK